MRESTFSAEVQTELFHLKIGFDYYKSCKFLFIKFSNSYFSFLAEVEGIAEEGSLLNAVNKLIETTETENREKALNDLRNIIIEKHQIFDNFDMHDAQEFLQILLQNLAVSFMTYNCSKYLQNN